MNDNYTYLFGASDGDDRCNECFIIVEQDAPLYLADAWDGHNLYGAFCSKEHMHANVRYQLHRLKNGGSAQTGYLYDFRATEPERQPS